uniref:SGNH hydrolase-type esterase domain-containing protein n=1 Tax=Echeneis naucrates TaxID=173247 RepID=A0A665WRD4_ECHNA
MLLPAPGHRLKRPKAVASSTTFHAEHWSRVGAIRGKGIHPFPSSQFNIHLNNKFDILSVVEFPPLSTVSQASLRPTPGCPSGIKVCSIPTLFPSSRLPLQAIQEPQPQAPRTKHFPSVLAVGTLLVRHVVVRGGRTFCHPSTPIADISSAAGLLSDRHRSASTLAIELGANDIKKQRSEDLKEDFRKLIDRLLDTGKQLVISGPLPSMYSGKVRFSRLLQLHTWLKVLTPAPEPLRAVLLHQRVSRY